MRFRWLSLVFVLLMSLNAVFAQRVSPTPVRDVQALDVLYKTVQAAGGLPAIDAFQNYSASGQIVFYSGEDKIEGETTVKGMGVKAFRIDAHMPDGEQWWFVKDGKGFKREATGTVRPLLFQEVLNIQSYCSPLGQVAQAIRDSKVEVSLMRPSTRQGRAALGVRIRNVPSRGKGIHDEQFEKKFYIDANTFQVLSVEDRAYPRDSVGDGIPRSLAFSDYRDVSGISFPFSISEDVAHHRHLMEIHFRAVSINTALTNRDFEP